jgi:hypothetical protein
LNPKVYSYIVEKLDKDDNTISDENVKKCKGVSKTVVEKNIKNDDYLKVLESDTPQEKIIVLEVIIIMYMPLLRKIALTSYYDKMLMVDSINCVPFGYKKK